MAGPVFGAPGFSGPIPPGSLFPADEFALELNTGPPVGGNDDLNALVIRLPPFGGPGAFLYSLSPAGALGPYSPADIISPTLPLGAPYAPAAALGLDTLGFATDDIDALIVQDIGPMIGVFDPDDFVAFSLTPGSLTLGLLGYAPGTGGADLFVPGPLPVLFMPAGAFGLLPTDDLDAVDVVPEPTIASMILAGFGLLVLHYRRQRCVG